MDDDKRLTDNTGNEYDSVEVDEEGNFLSGVRKDGMVDLPIDLPSDVWLEVAFEAHRLDITLNAHLTNIIMAACDEVERQQTVFEE